MTNRLYTLLVLVLLSSCASYQQNVLFTADDAPPPPSGQREGASYIIAANDYLRLEVFTKNGERIIDPDFQLNQEAGRQQNIKPDFSYLVQHDGVIKLPLVGEVALAGLTLADAEKLLEEKYTLFYKSPFVKLSFVNKRVIVLGASGGQVIPLENQNMTVAEVLALAGGIQTNGKGTNMKLIRGDEVFLLDFSTYEQYQQSKMTVQPGDILYIEPVRRPFNEFLRDNGPIISIFSSLVSLIVVLVSLN